MREDLRLLTLAITAICGCMVGEDQPPQLSTTYHAITNAKWLSCWVRPAPDGGDPFYSFDTVECSAPIGEGKPKLKLVRLEALADAGNKIESATLQDAKPLEILRIQRDKYPVEIRATFNFTIDDPVLRSVNGTSVRSTLKIPARSSFSFESPAIVEQAYDLWEINIEAQSDVFTATFDKYDVTLPDGYLSAVDPPQPKLEIVARMPVVEKGQSLTFMLPVSRGDRPHLTGEAKLQRGNNSAGTRFAIDGPGAYIASSSGITRKPNAGGTGTASQGLTTCPASWNGDGFCDHCLANDSDCRANNTPGCEAQWRDDGICDSCLGSDPDCGATTATCPTSWRGDGVCDECLGNDPDCASTCPAYFRGDGVCDTCLGNDPDCTAAAACPASWRGDGVCDLCLGNDPDCATAATCPTSWRGDGVCDECLGDDPDCSAPGCPSSWRGDGVCDECLGNDPDCSAANCPSSWYDDGVCDTCLGNDPDCAGTYCPASWYGDGYCDLCLGDDPDCI